MGNYLKALGVEVALPEGADAGNWRQIPKNLLGIPTAELMRPPLYRPCQGGEVLSGHLVYRGGPPGKGKLTLVTGGGLVIVIVSSKQPQAICVPLCSSIRLRTLAVRQTPSGAGNSQSA
jgi:hypothetical protein